MDALKKNQEKEFERNKERFNFLKWGAKAFKNFTIVPPGSGIVHQVNLEYLSRTVFFDQETKLVYPDSVVGTDSHTVSHGTTIMLQYCKIVNCFIYRFFLLL